VIPKAQHDIALGRDGSVTPYVVRKIRLIAMLTAVELDGDAATVLGEIEKVSAHGDLAAKVKTLRIQLAQLPPEQTFHIGSAVAQPPSAMNRSCL
jgi:hypothetical protein